MKRSATRHSRCSGAILALAASVGLAIAARPAPRQEPVAAKHHHAPASARLHATQSECPGCSGHGHREAPLTETALRSAFEAFAGGDDDAAFDTLLYHRDHVLRACATGAANALPAAARAKLQHELAVEDARLSLRIVGDDGAVLTSINDATVPLGTKAHIQTAGVHGAPSRLADASGTVLRVGRDHLWARY